MGLRVSHNTVGQKVARHGRSSSVILPVAPVAHKHSVARYHSLYASTASGAAAIQQPGPSTEPQDEQAPLHARKAVAAARAAAIKAALSAEESANVLGRFLGNSGGIAPAAVLDLDQDQILGLLEAVWRRADPILERALYGHAAAVTNRFYGGKVFFRGLVEFSNVCQNDCGYCGIRNNQKDVWRYTMPQDEVVEVAKWALQNNIRNIMLQSGELRTEQRIQYLEQVIRAIRSETVAMDLARRAAEHDGAVSGGSVVEHDDDDVDELGVAVSLSVGELPIQVYERFYKAGARRYLIRIETSNPQLYAALHQPPLDWQHRVECLQNLKKVGYMLGTGVMVGLPGQTLRDLAGDVLFFKQMKADMIGMGPFITQAGTPVSDMWSHLYPHVDKTKHMKQMFELTTAMNALVRITMGNVNISATTAMQAIIPTGREIALERGANVVMPILTPTKYRESYQLYEGKPCITDTAVQCRACLDMRLKFAGKEAAPGVWGDPDSYLHPVAAVSIPHLGSPVLDAAASADLHEMGADAYHPMPLTRLVEVPDDNVKPQDHPHGSRRQRSSGKAVEHDHDDHDHDHHHDLDDRHDDGHHDAQNEHQHQHGHHHAQQQQVANSAVAFDASSYAAAPTATSSASSSSGSASAVNAQQCGSHASVTGAAVACVGKFSKSSCMGLRAPMVAPAIVPRRHAAIVQRHPCKACHAVASDAAQAGASSATAHGVPRINVGVFGKMNAGKSTLVNVLAQQEACIVDDTPGTTADVKTVLMELHGLGPAKILDTAGLDETGVLGEKKRRKALNTLKECDVAVIVVDTEQLQHARNKPWYDVAAHLQWERSVMEQASKYGASPVLLLNVKPSCNGALDADAMLHEVLTVLDPSQQIPAMAMDLSGMTHDNMLRCSDFVKMGTTRSPRWGKPLPGCLPRWSLGKGSMLLMVIPMDMETPGGRLLRPQAMVQEEAIRHWATVISVRLDLDAARGKLGEAACEAERQRFSDVIKLLEHNMQGPVLVVTDSQAVDVVHPWTLDAASGKPRVPFTTFSIAMAYHQSGGVLDPFVDGLTALSHLHPDDRVLIAEACNHTRITDNCNDIGMVQIPTKLEAMAGGKLHIEHAFGREFPELEAGKLGKYKVAIHCGGCMIDTQKMQQRMHDLSEAHVPVVNYGTFFSWAVAPEALQRALEPWGVEPPLPLTSASAQAHNVAAPTATRKPVATGGHWQVVTEE